MDSTSSFLQNEIRSQYRSIRQFAEKTGIDYRTVMTCISKGMLQSKFETVNEICNKLDIHQDFDDGIRLFGRRYQDLKRRMSLLDDTGIERVKAAIEREYARCKGEADEADCCVLVPFSEL